MPSQTAVTCEGACPGQESDQGEHGVQRDAMTMGPCRRWVSSYLEHEEVSGFDEDTEGAELVLVRLPRHRPPVNAVLAGVCCVITSAAGNYAALEYNVVALFCRAHMVESVAYMHMHSCSSIRMEMNFACNCLALTARFGAPTGFASSCHTMLAQLS